jgi:peptidoglycan/LPS O-acetylase OafA/YrhL
VRDARDPGHLPALDGLRGLAATIVVVRHCYAATAIPDSLRFRVLASPFALFLNADAAIQLFFALSGFVLAGSLLRNRHPSDLAQYAIRRVMRIHPPYAAGVLTAWAASLFFYRIPVFGSPWIAGPASVHLTTGQLLASLGFPGPAFGLLGVGWTLRIEMIFSGLLPVMLFVARSLHWGIVALFFGWVVADSRVVGWPLHGASFALGMIALLEGERIERAFSRASPAAHGAVVTFALLLYAAPLALGFAIERSGLIVHGFAAFLLISAARFVPAVGALLAARPLRFLGRTSYSFYLLHMPVLILLAPFVLGRAPILSFLTLAAAVLVVTLPLAALFFRWIERPSIRLGNRLCAGLAARLGTERLSSRLADGA